MEAVNFRRTEGRTFGGAFALAICIGSIAGGWRSLLPLFSAWNQQEYSHAWFIVPLAVLIFTQRLRTAQIGGNYAIGVPLVALAVAIMLFAWTTGSYTLTIYGTILGLAGFAWASFGSNSMRVLAAPLVYLLFVVPPPLTIYMSLSAEMQLLSSRLGTIFISLFQVPALLDGNVIVLATGNLEVAEACNGLRYLFPLMGFAYLVSMLMEDRLWKKVLVLLSCFPIAIFMNAGRIAMIAVLLGYFDLDTSVGVMHTVAGFAVFSLCIGVLFLEVWCLLSIGNPPGRFLVSDLMIVDKFTLDRLINWPLSRSSLSAGIVLLAGAGLLASLPAVRAEIMPTRQPLALFPMEYKIWRGVPHVLDGDLADSMGFTDYLLADYVDPTVGLSLNFYVAYYASQHAGAHPHSPQFCIPGGGWTITSQSVVELPFNEGVSIDVNRAIIEKRDVKQVVYYWFEERGRHIANENALRYYAIRDAIVENRSDGALIRIVATIHNGEDAKADAVVKKFVADIGPMIESYVPSRMSREPGIR
ncbi:VPLPA-CTERM-specific exosortase XrtD [Bradyrhizobium sp. LTSP857]|uniref:VPLPA-CTERM-specific exosortase XrtD n=1 Tax=Bradyrhizobium sp. LTSP857 TaxID=1619231 RepID=UPI0005D1C111|nr:VPLPA-CTERM-specific exosortase XrtD [Bradyrhizobium sp. LTSP857]KJC36488.1 hypothetical protein UP06_32785 [Bradyrhizobium sp. LTSP857]